MTFVMKDHSYPLREKEPTVSDVVEGEGDSLRLPRSESLLEELLDTRPRIRRNSEQLSRVYSTFHVSNLKKCLSDETLAIPLDEIQIDEKLHFIEEPVKIMDREVKRLKQSRIPIVKVRWNSRRGPEFTWESKDQLQKKYPHLFSNSASVTGSFPVNISESSPGANLIVFYHSLSSVDAFLGF
nr:putative reverse transcriptase domain-containing protein [Tanacetum cinerariifolium]